MSDREFKYNKEYFENAGEMYLSNIKWSVGMIPVALLAIGAIYLLESFMQNTVENGGTLYNISVLLYDLFGKNGYLVFTYIRYLMIFMMVVLLPLGILLNLYRYRFYKRFQGESD